MLQEYTRSPVLYCTPEEQNPRVLFLDILYHLENQRMPNITLLFYWHNCFQQRYWCRIQLRITWIIWKLSTYVGIFPMVIWSYAPFFHHSQYIAWEECLAKAAVHEPKRCASPLCLVHQAVPTCPSLDIIRAHPWLFPCNWGFTFDTVWMWSDALGSCRPWHCLTMAS